MHGESSRSTNRTNSEKGQILPKQSRARSNLWIVEAKPGGRKIRRLRRDTFGWLQTSAITASSAMLSEGDADRGARAVSVGRRAGARGTRVGRSSSWRLLASKFDSSLIPGAVDHAPPENGRVRTGGSNRRDARAIAYHRGGRATDREESPWITTATEFLVVKVVSPPLTRTWALSGCIVSRSLLLPLGGYRPEPLSSLNIAGSTLVSRLDARGIVAPIPADPDDNDRFHGIVVGVEPNRTGDAFEILRLLERITDRGPRKV